MSDEEGVRATKEAQALYEQRVSSFEDDELSAHQRMRRRYGMAALGLGGLLGFSEWRNWRLGEEIVRLSTAKPVTSVVVAADTGAPYLVHQQVGPPMGLEEKQIKHMAWLFVANRFQWTAKEDNERFHIVQAMCSRDEQQRHKQWWEEDPKGPRKTMYPNGEARIQTRGDPRLFKSPGSEIWDFLEYPIRRAVLPAGQNKTVQETDLKIVVFFGWSHDALRGDQILVNPYGFVVTGCRMEWARGGTV